MRKAMKNIQVLGNRCTKCIKTLALIEQVAKDINCNITLKKDTSPQAILAYGVMSTPAIIINDKLIYSGSIPSLEQVQSWLKAKS